MKPSRVSVRSVAFWILTMVLAVLAGFAFGNRRASADTLSALQTEAEGNLTQRIEVLSLLRTDSLSRAIQMLEEQTDYLITTIAANPGHNRDALVMAKAYRMAVPPPASRAEELNRVFSQLPVPRREQCLPALRILIERTPAGSTIK